MDYIRRKVMRRLHKRMKEVMTWKGRLPPNVQKKLDLNREEGRTCKVLEADDYDLEIIDDTTHESFCKGSLTGPKAHWLRERVANYVDSRLTVRAYIVTYSESTKPLPDQAIWPSVRGPEIEPPEILVQVGRAKKHAREKELNELLRKRKNKQTVKCINCSGIGHNKRSCKNPVESSFQVAKSLNTTQSERQSQLQP
ncbi:hypothetical protein WN943_003645 [Citrus x changshan-huyou]